MKSSTEIEGSRTLGPIQLHFRSAKIGLFCLALNCAPVMADDCVLVPADYVDWQTVSSPQVSPDGSYVAYERKSVDVSHDRWRSSLRLIDLRTGSDVLLANDASQPRWSPRGDKIAFKMPDAQRVSQVYVLNPQLPENPVALTNGAVSPRDYAWSKDSSTIAFTRFQPLPVDTFWQLQLPDKTNAEWTRAPDVMTDSHFRRDGQGLRPNGVTSLFVVDTNSEAKPRRVTAPDVDLWIPAPQPVLLDWIGNGREIVVNALVEADADVRYRESSILAIDVDTGAIRTIAGRGGFWRDPQVSPDGQYVAYRGFPKSRRGFETNSIYISHVDGSGKRELTGDLDRNVREFRWSADSKLIYLIADDHGKRNIWAATLDGMVTPVTTGEQMLSDLSLNGSGTVAVAVRTSHRLPSDVIAMRLPEFRQIRQLTHVNTDVLESKAIAEVERIRYSSVGDIEIDGWIMKPPFFDESLRYPLVLYIHGGPHGMYGAEFTLSFQYLAAEGYVVLFTNPRGSAGYGGEFANEIDKQFPGSADLEDFMKGVDYMLSTGYIDDERLYVTGGSAGGVYTTWIVGHTDRFAAASARSVVTNFLSFAGTSDFPPLEYHLLFDDYPWNAPAEWLQRSPLMHVGNVSTPTLLMGGKLDLRTPLAQAEEFYQALRIRGIPTAMLQFHGEYHWPVSRPSNFMRIELYTQRWFNNWVYKDGRHQKNPDADADADRKFCATAN